MSKLKLLLLAVASTFNSNMTPDIAATSVSTLLQSCEQQYDATVAAGAGTFNYADCITNVAMQLNIELNPANLNDVMEYYSANMASYTEIINSQSELAELNAEGGIVTFLRGMSKTGLAVLIAKLAAAVGLGFIAKKAVKGLMLVTNYLIGAVKQPVVATEQVEQAELVATQELKRATDELSKIRRTANTVARAAHKLMTPIIRKRQEAAAAIALHQLNTSLGVVSSSSQQYSFPVSSSQQLIRRTISTKKRAAINRANTAKMHLYGVSKFPLYPIQKIGGRKTKNSRNKRNRRNSRRK
jgi:hypothetical protein